MAQSPEEGVEEQNLARAGVSDPAHRAVESLESAFSSPSAEGTDETEIKVLDENITRLEAAKKEEEARKKEEAKAATLPSPELVKVAPERKKLRLLLVTTDTSFFIEGSKMQTEYIAFAQYFDEVHVIVMNDHTESLPDSLRAALNMWVYATNSRSKFLSIYSAYSLAKKQLVLATGFRADVVAAADPFEAGVAAYFIARKYKVPLQIEVPTNPFEEDFKEQRNGNNWRLLGARFVMPRAACLLVHSARMQGVLERRYKKMKERIVFLPPFRDIVFFKDAQPLFNLHERYPQFKFIILVASSLDAHAKVDFAIDVALPFIRQYPTIGLIIVGDGSERDRLLKKVTAMDLRDRIVFEPETNDLVSHMKSSNLLLNVVSNEEQDILIAAAAAAGLPTITVAGEMANRLFEDGVNAFVCPEDDLNCFEARIGEFLNNNQLRTAFSLNGRNRVFSVIEQDPNAYREAFVAALEQCVLNAPHT